MEMEMAAVEVEPLEEEATWRATCISGARSGALSRYDGRSCSSKERAMKGAPSKEMAMGARVLSVPPKERAVAEIIGEPPKEEEA